MENPLLINSVLPQFSRLKLEHIEPAVRQVIAKNEVALQQLTRQDKVKPDWNNLIQVLDNLEDRLTNLWSTVSHLYSVNNSPELREIYERCQPLVTDYFTHLSQNQALYERINALQQGSDKLGLSSSQKKIIDDYLLDFRLAGVNLEADKKQRFTVLEKNLNQLSNKFSNNVLDATNAWSKQITDEKQLTGIPELAVSNAAMAAKQKGLDGFLLTLDFPCYNAVITYADDESLRRDIYTAFVTRASALNGGNEAWNNEEIINDILQLRREKAELLGYEGFTELSLAKKMAASPAKVLEFLNDLVESGKPMAEQEYKQLQDFTADLGTTTLNAWDIAYFSEKLRKQLYDISQEELRVYFPVTRVQQGLFSIVEQLYGIKVRRNYQYDVWDSSVEAFDIFRDDKLIACFYMDLYTRDNKRSGAWMGECRSRRLLDDGTIQLPAAYLICNFSKGAGDAIPLLTHTEVTTLFHEFGHGLHHLLTIETNLRVSGINGVAWDAIELPSQLMENWCWDKESLQLICAHHESGQPIPAEMLQKMLAAKNFQAGLKMMRQLEFALFDFELHAGLHALDPSYVRETMAKVRAKTAVYPTPDFNRFENSFSHIFAGGYAAGYYSYYWAEVLSADVFSKFNESGIFDGRSGRDFLNKLLSRGGAEKALKLFMDFMGREPEIKALLKQKGIQSGQGIQNTG